MLVPWRVVVSLFPSSYDCFKNKEFLDDSEQPSDSGLHQVGLSKTPWFCMFLWLQNDCMMKLEKKGHNTSVE